MAPTADQIRGQLERLLASSVFANAGRMSRFLRFVVEQTLAGEGERLKEYVVGVEVFDRDTNYDPRVDAIVRVEAARLRSKLAEYYAGEGHGDPVVLSLPKGGYAPVMKLENRFGGGVAGAPIAGADTLPRAERAAELPAPPALLASRARRSFIGAALAGGIAVAAVAWLSWRDLAPVASNIRVAVLPFAPFPEGTDDAEAVAARITEGVTAELVDEGAFPIVSSSAARAVYSQSARPREIATELNASLLIEARVTLSRGRVSVEARATDATEQKLWVQSFAGDAAETDTLEREIAKAILAGPVSVLQVVRRD